MTEKPSVCKHCQKVIVVQGQLCPTRILQRMCEPVADPAEPSASPQIPTCPVCQAPMIQMGSKWPHTAWTTTCGHSSVSAEPTAASKDAVADQYGFGTTPERAPQPVAGEGPPKFFDGELIPIHWCPGLKKFVLYPSLFCLKHNRGSGEVDYVPVTSEGTPKLEEIAAKILQATRSYVTDSARTEVITDILRPLITPAGSPLPNRLVCTTLASSENQSYVQGWNDCLDVAATPASTGEPPKNHRWNLEHIDGGIRICEGHHERSAGCEWTEYVPRASTGEAQSLKELANKFIGDERWREYFFMHDAKKALIEFALAVEKLSTGEANGWISVEERLPEWKKRVLTWNGTRNLVDYIWDVSNTKWHNGSPTHWRELPPAPTSVPQAEPPK